MRGKGAKRGGGFGVGGFVWRVSITTHLPSYLPTKMLSAAILASAFALTAAQDPAEGWLAYARALPPSGKPGQRLTKISARWKNLKNPRPSQSFYSPWFGIDTADNLNLLQPVNPWL